MRFFGKRSQRSLDDPDFGHIEEQKSGAWEGRQLQLWGYHSVQVLVDAGPEGPSAGQRAFFGELRGNPDRIKEHIEEAISQYIVNMPDLMSKPGPIKLTTIYLPANPLGERWRVWYDMQGEDIYSFGAEITDSQKIIPFAED